MLNRIIKDLAENFRGDEEVLENLINDITSEALFISNRRNDDFNKNILNYEISECVKSIYLQRGAEDVSSRSESGVSSSYKNAIEKLRNDIIRNGKRVLP